MSTTRKKFSFNLLILVEFLLFAAAVAAQQIEVNVKVNSNSPAVLRVEGKFTPKAGLRNDKSWAFLRSFAGAENLGARISDLTLTDLENQNVPIKKLIDGEYLAEREAAAWSYQMNIKPLPNEKSAAHVSWLKDERGILMTGDLLPQFVSAQQPISAQIKFELPPGWKILTGEKALTENTFSITDIEKAVFLIGINWREVKTGGGDNLSLAISGEWNFTDAEAAAMAGDIFARYRKSFGAISNSKIQILLFRFPPEIKSGRWEADTRGTTTTIFSSDMPFKTLSLQRLHEQLRHEIFHLWVPNNLALTGNYDWFYEGFTVYEALKTGVATNQIRFEDFLDTLSQAYNSDNFQTPKMSLVEASKNRWSGANSRIYSRGMLVAFLCDLALLRESGGKYSIDDIFRQLLEKYNLPNQPQDGNTAILDVLKSRAELDAIVQKYIEGTDKINWQTDLESAGIEISDDGFNTKLSVKAKPNKRQKDLLDKLGYNNWRKILQ